MAVNAPVRDCVLMCVGLNRRAREASNPVAGGPFEDRGHCNGVIRVNRASTLIRTVGALLLCVAVAGAPALTYAQAHSGGGGGGHSGGGGGGGGHSGGGGGGGGHSGAGGGGGHSAEGGGGHFGGG